MSKAEKSAKPGTSSVLRKDLGLFNKSLEQIVTSVAKHEKLLADAEIALHNELSLEEKIDKLQQQVIELQKACTQATSSRDADTASFTDVNQKIFKEYEARSMRMKHEYDIKLKECQKREATLEQHWRQKSELEMAEIRRLKAVKSHVQQEYEDSFNKAREIWRGEQERLQSSRQQSEQEVATLRDMTKSLEHNLAEYEAIIKGRDIELHRATSRLATLEAFPAQASEEDLTRIIARLQNKLHDFCVQCVDSAELLPGWNRIPDGIQKNDLPKVFSSESLPGRWVMIAAVQNCVCTAMYNTVFLKLGPHAGRRFCSVAEALYHRDQSHEAIWRLMTVNTLLEDRSMVEQCKNELHQVAKSLISSWNPFPGQTRTKECHELLTQLLFDATTIFLGLQKNQRSISVSVEVVSQYFDSDSEEDAYEVPGGFKLPDSTLPVLCLFPAFFWDVPPNKSHKSTLIRKGTAMFRDSPPLLAALSQEKETMSPKLSNKSAR